MSVGGKIIAIREVRPGVSALWVLDDHPSGDTETCVHVETEAEMPSLGENVWWQSGKVMWDGDRRELRKVGFSHNPHDCQRQELAMTDDALRALRDAVKAGTDTAHHHAAAFPSERAYGHCTWHDSHKASTQGSLDAAHALHKAVLPGWRWITRNTSAGDVERGVCKEDDFGFANVWESGEPNMGAEYFFAFSATPARAWLLAILETLIAQQGAGKGE